MLFQGAVRKRHFGLVYFVPGTALLPVSDDLHAIVWHLQVGPVFNWVSNFLAYHPGWYQVLLQLIQNQLQIWQDRVWFGCSQKNILRKFYWAHEKMFERRS